jgi:hypothetical protein
MLLFGRFGSEVIMTRKTRSILLAAVLATPLGFFAAPAEAQFRKDTGAANDANNQIGSNGSNGGPRDLGINRGDFVINGTVTGGREFRGQTAIGDPRALRAPTAGGISDRFIRSSSSAYTNNAQTVRPFYGVSEGVAPPPGYMQQGVGTQAFVPAPPPERLESDLRMGDIYNTDRNAFTAPRPGELMIPGAVDNSNANSVLRASPLYGVVEDDGNTAADDASRPGYQNFRRRSAIPGLDDQQVQKARTELRSETVTDDPADAAAKSNDLNLGARNAIGAPKETPGSSALPGGEFDSSVKTQSMGGQIKAEGSQRNELVPPVEQSTQYAELHNRFSKNKPTGPMTDQQKANEFNQQFQTRQRLENEKKSGRGMPGTPGSSINRPSGGGRVTFPSAGGIPSGGGATTATPPAEKSTEPTPPVENKTPSTELGPITPPTEPAKQAPAKTNNEEAPTLNNRPGEMLTITSLTEGMKPGRVKDMLGAAEDQMRQGQYTGAFRMYDDVERIVPNNPLVTLGKANAELAGTYYARAEENIRKALEADNALLMAKFDMEKLIGKERIAFLDKDLKGVVATEPKQSRAPFLLAYLKFHTGDKKMAANYLALSEQRLGKEDPLYRQMRLTWDLPKADPLPENK